MRKLAGKPIASQQTTPAKTSIPGQAGIGQSSHPSSILHRQHAIGNEAGPRKRTEQNSAEFTGSTSAKPGHDFFRIPMAPSKVGATQMKPSRNEPEGADKQQASHFDASESRIPATVREVLHSNGRSLDRNTRTFMERRFHHDFSHVRIHTDLAAAKSVKVVNAKAFAHGRNIVFGSGEYAPHTFDGQQLLAHELVHVAQQRAQSVLPTRISNPHDTEERQAERVAASFFNNAPLSLGAATGRSGILYRQTRPTPGAPAPPAPRRIVYLDYNVIDQINRGNRNAANAFQKLRSSGAEIRISHWTSREMLQDPKIPRTVAANRLLIQELGIKIDPEIPFERRVQLAVPNQTNSGTVLSPNALVTP